MLTQFIIYTVCWLCIELIYFKLARHFKIVDKPNARSSHHHVTIRGGGIIFALAALFGFTYANIDDVIVGGALLTISIVSILDDIGSLKSQVRLLVQIFSVMGLFYFFSPELNIIWFPVMVLMIAGIINIYNFMDGINGITVLYTLATIGSLFWVQKNIIVIGSDRLFVSLSCALLVFAFFNLRKKAKAFAGDVGSISVAFVICYLILGLVLKTQWLLWGLFLSIYGIDAVFTIVCRIFRKEPLMQAHRSHFYQYLANEAGWGHIQVSLLYTFAQIISNLTIIYAYVYHAEWVAIATLFGFVIIYGIFRLRLEGPKRLFVAYNPIG